MSDQPDHPGYPVDADHDRLLLELTDPNGTIIASIPLAPPVNRNPAAPYAIQIRLMHADGCWRVLQRDPLATY